MHFFYRFPGGEVYLYSGVTREGVTLKVDDVADGVVEQQEEFFACSGCGKIYWKGSHWDKIKLKDVEKRTAALELNPRIWNHGYELYDDA